MSVQRTGKLVEGQAEYQVTIGQHVSMSTVRRYRALCWPVHREAGPKSASLTAYCLVAGGGAIVQGARVGFTYAWKTP
uniref:Uncharacterized protein n=1 Tax=Leersia perrieri TaxID=77586 RepID=A0A0D9XSB9_9ORYZ